MIWLSRIWSVSRDWVGWLLILILIWALWKCRVRLADTLLFVIRSLRRQCAYVAVCDQNKRVVLLYRVLVFSITIWNYSNFTKAHHAIKFGVLLECGVVANDIVERRLSTLDGKTSVPTTVPRLLLCWTIDYSSVYLVNVLELWWFHWQPAAWLIGDLIMINTNNFSLIFFHFFTDQ